MTMEPVRKRLEHRDKLFVAESAKRRIGDFRAGVSLESRTGYSIDQIVIQATLDRVRFAAFLLESSQRAMRRRPPEFRLAASRAYYSMYHAFRAVVFFRSDGDDHEKHAELPDHIPRDFPDRDVWQNRLKSARLERNRADYTPYPVADGRFRTEAKNAVEQANKLLPEVRAYLKKKGCVR